MNPQEIESLPSPLQRRANEAFRKKSQPLVTTYNTLLLLQEATLYLAGLAVAEYRGLAEQPDLKAEMAIASFNARITFESYSKVLLRCIESTGRNSKMHALLEAKFPTAPQLSVLIKAAESRARDIGENVALEIEAARNMPGTAPSFGKYLQLLADFRNRGFAHADWHGLDGATDFFLTAAPVLRDVAHEFLKHSAVMDALSSLRPATVSEVIESGVHVEYTLHIVDDSTQIDVCHKSNGSGGSGSSSSYKTSQRVLVRYDDSPEILGLYREFRHGIEMLNPRVEETIDAILRDEGPGEALKALFGFAEQARNNKKLCRKWLKPGLVDDVVISALQHFKFNGNNDDEEIPQHVFSLLEFTSDKLPRRIIRDAERFEAFAIRYPTGPQNSVRGDLIQQARSGPIEQRQDAVIRLAFRDDNDSLQALSEIVSNDERRRVRKQALLSIGKRGDPRSADLLMSVADKHRGDPEIACCALIGLASINRISAVDYLAKYVLGSASYACTDSAAWGLAALASKQPEGVGKWQDELRKYARKRDNDPYTRGTVLYCLSKLGDPDLADEFVVLICAEEDAFVVEDACAALAASGDERSMDVLAGVLDATEGALADLCVKREAIRALGAIGGGRAEEALMGFTPPSDCRFIERVRDEALLNCRADPDQPGEESQPINA